MVPKANFPTKVWPPLGSREHGSWVIAGVPLIIGAAVARRVDFNWVALAAAIFALVAARGAFPAATSKVYPVPDLRVRARVWLSIYAVIAATAAFFLVLAAGRIYLLALGLAGSGAWLADLGRTLAGPLATPPWAKPGIRAKQGTLVRAVWGAASLAIGAPAAYYVGTGRLGTTALGLWLVTAFYFVARVALVEVRLGWGRRSLTYTERLYDAAPAVAMHIAGLGLLYFVAPQLGLPPYLWVALLPGVLAALVSVVDDHRRLSVKALGLVETGLAGVFALLTVLAFNFPLGT